MKTTLPLPATLAALLTVAVTSGCMNPTAPVLVKDLSPNETRKGYVDFFANNENLVISEVDDRDQKHTLGWVVWEGGKPQEAGNLLPSIALQQPTERLRVAAAPGPRRFTTSDALFPLSKTDDLIHINVIENTVTQVRINYDALHKAASNRTATVTFKISGPLPAEGK